MTAPLTELNPPSIDSRTPARILVVDDQPANIQMVGSVLGKMGHEIIPAMDGETALRRLEARLPDLILLDLLMPGMDGCEVCARLRQRPEWKDIPVIFLSAADDKELIVRALESGGTDYVTKPFNQAELVTRVQMQLDLKWTRDRLKQLVEDKTELLGILAHDLKNRLGGMQMSAQLLTQRLVKQGWSDGRILQLAENIEHSSDQMLNFVKEFLANAAADYGFQPRLVPVHLVEIVENVVRQYQELARRKQLEMTLEKPLEPAVILGDASAMDQVLDNLLSNAVKFSPAGKRISIRVENQGKFVECHIQDQGPGFTEEDKRKMFRRYVRLSARPTAGEPSTGFGLSVVQKLIQSMMGELQCTSTPGTGTVFTLRFARVSPQ